jgi:hypothetical protein
VYIEELRERSSGCFENTIRKVTREVRAARINCQTSPKTKSGLINDQITIKHTAARNATG